jgi:hypothetical protein
MIDIASIFRRLPRETARTLIEQARITTPGLEENIYKQLAAAPGTPGSVMPEPVLEGTFPWLADSSGWTNAAETLHPRTLELLKKVSFEPFEHQVAAWRALRAKEIKSTIVSSGTGSGKTECFLTPVTDHLITLSDGGSKPLSGVRAIMLYPLNALINSQEERLSKWFKEFHGNLRYCLYNGVTPQHAKAQDAKATPEKVIDRQSLRANPPPVLVTNITMLEYMLVRQEDASILNKSQGKLDYIILDEAHSYVGAQAAELSLLLRRVAAAFGKSPSEIRYVATSATIGDGSSETLGQFLADVAGVPRENVEVITGERAPLCLTGDNERPESLPALQALTPDERADFLFSNRWLSQARQQLRSDTPMSWSDWVRVTSKVTGDEKADNSDAIALLDVCTQTKKPGTTTDLLPTRLHLFHKTLPGFSVCPNKNCHGKPTEMPSWPYGAITPEKTEHCSDCGSIMFEWVSCRSCGDGALLGSESDDGSHIKPYRMATGADDFFQELEVEAPEDEGEEEPDSDDGLNDLKQYLLSSCQDGISVCFDPQSGKHLDVPVPNATNLISVRDVGNCPHCGEPHKSRKGDALRPVYAGAPYLVRQIVPALLPNLSGRNSDNPLPLDGRSLITFTDARQGTAQHAAMLQISSEMEFVRGFIYHAVQYQPPTDPERIAKLELDIKKLKAADLHDLATEKELELADAAAIRKPVPVSDLIRDLSQHKDVRGSLLDLWSARTETTNNPEDLAEFLLLRELARRPKWAASGETLGLYRLEPPRKARVLPTIARECGLGADDWETLLQLVITHYLRQNQMLQVRKPGWFRYAKFQGAGRSLVRRPDDISDKNVQQAWPSVHWGAANRTSWVSLISQSLSLPFSDAASRDTLESLLDALYQSLQKTDCLAYNEFGQRLDWTKLCVAHVSEAEICPVTRVPLQAAFKGVSIYKSSNGTHPKTERVRFPEFPYVHRRHPDGSATNTRVIDEWLTRDEQVTTLRSKQLWDNRTDRAVRYEGYFRSAEHSAQLSQPDLQAYEAKFKSGELNVLSCSTTMEMGVDIGDVEAVLNTNAPPSTANYKQRLGRAGRRGQSLSLGVTICKDRPLDNQVAADPIAYIRRTQAAPKVSLESNAIVQRHVNAWLLSIFMKEAQGSLLSLTVGGFFQLEQPNTNSPYTEFLEWIDHQKAVLATSDPLVQLLARTRLVPGEGTIETCYEHVTEIYDSISLEWEALGGRFEGPKNADEPLTKAQSAQRKRLEGEYLLSALSGRNFLPAYGFPTGVVQFWIETSEERRQREGVNGPTSFEDRRFLSRGMPSRQRNIGIYEYAPGSEIVIDGLSRKSAGLTLNWQRPVTDQDVREVQSLRSMHVCKSCGELSSKPTAIDFTSCEACGAETIDTIRYIAPAGFTIDPRDRVTDKRDGGEYTPRQLSVVGATGGEWLSLPDPDLGRLRSAQEGIVFDRNNGAHNFGFAVCLECGRAAAEDAEPGNPLPTSMSNHKPLRWTPNAGPNEICPGTIRPFGIQRNLSLGDEYRTTVFELQLENVNSKKTAITIALSLREAVGDRLGIEATEMGVAATESLDRDGNPRWTSVVFDAAAGGAGFAAQIADDPATTISDAARFLDCRRQGACGEKDARRVCPNCVLRPDVQHLQDKTDRRAAYEALVEAARRLVLPDEFKLYGDTTKYLPNSICSALRSYVHHTGANGMFLRAQGALADWELDQWEMNTILLRYFELAQNTLLLIDQDALDGASALEKVELALWANKHSVKVAVVPRTWSSGTAIIASHGDQRRHWGAKDINLIPGPKWGASDAPTVFSDAADWKTLIAPIDTMSWLSEPGAKSIAVIDQELDGNTKDFGTKFRALVGVLNPKLAAGPPLDLTKITISDRYIFNPLAVRLYYEICAAFGDQIPEIEIITRGSKHQDHRSSFKLDHDWKEISDRDGVMEVCLQNLTHRVELTLPRDVPHRRTIQFELGTGEFIEVVLDQGVGSWKPIISPNFNFAQSSSQQAVDLLKSNFMIRCAPGGTFVGVL